MTVKGIIALDIDGTLTHGTQDLDEDVAGYLTELAESGWSFIFITGRTFEWGNRTLQTLPFFYYLSVQNGAITLEMPSRKIVAAHYFDGSILSRLDAYRKDYVIYGGYEQQDVCYYRPKEFSETMLQYLMNRCRELNETWVPLDSFESLPISFFPAVKFFATTEEAESLSETLEEQFQLHAPAIRDPFNSNIYVIQGTLLEVNKGEALRDVSKLYPPGILRIAAGDDNNDRPLLKAADVSIAMATAPLDVRALAHIVAPSAEDNGIIEGLKRAIGLYSHRIQN